MSALDGALADVNLAMLVYLVALNALASALIAVAWIARDRGRTAGTRSSSSERSRTRS